MRFTKAMAALLLALLVLSAVAVRSSGAQDLGVRLAGAEANVATYEGELPAQRQLASAAEARYRVAVQHAAPSLHALRRSKAEARRIRAELAAKEQKANARIGQAEDEHQQEMANHDEEVRNGVGFGLAALVAGLIALLWGFFRASAPVAALTEVDLSRAVGLCVAGGLLAVIVGIALGQANGVVGALGSFIACLGLILPTALLLARHSAEVQRGRSQPLLHRERLPNWVSIAVAGLMLVLFLASTGSAIFAPSASSQSISPKLQEEAEGAAGQSGAELKVAQKRLRQAKRRAAVPLARRLRARRQLASASGEFNRTKGRLAAARSSERSFSRRLVALEAREQRELEREEARALREQGKQEEIEAEEFEEELASECDPNYSGCLDPNSPDYDCEGGSGNGPDYTGTVTVLGVDHYGLDSDGDGIGCEPE